MIYDAVIIGGGACGLMCAVQMGFLGKRALVLEKNSQIGAKILISGGGRCNYTNLYASQANFISENAHFCKSALSQWTVEDTIAFFEAYGIYGQEKTLGQLFPVDQKAKDIVQLFKQLCAELGQIIYCDAEVKAVVQKSDGGFSLNYMHAGENKQLQVPKVVLASGGLSIPKIGASDFALKIAQKFGLKTTKHSPALVPLTITGKDAEWYTHLSGNTVFCRVSNEKITFEEQILFTHWGLSGPAILQISSYWEPGESIQIDLLPHQSIKELILAEKMQQGKKLLSSFLSAIYTKKFAEALGKFLPIDKQLAVLNKEELFNIDQLIHHFKVKPAGTKGYDKAEVMKGGIATEELSSKTLMSKKVPGLYFGGECIDVTGWLGGYNFQWAWANAYVIAQDI